MRFRPGPAIVFHSPMTPTRPIQTVFILLALAVVPLPHARAFIDEWELDYDTLAESGQKLFEHLAPPSVQESFRFYTADELKSTFGPIQHALAGGSLGALAEAQPRARQTLDSLRANPETQAYADWLEARMDFFEMAAEVEQAIPAPLAPAAPARPVPGPPLVPHPTPARPALIPHPQEPDTPALPPHPALPQPTLIPHPTEPPAPARPPPTSGAPPAPLDTARNRYVENRQVWVRKLANRPAPARAAALLPGLKKIFREEGIPSELVWQAEAESTFNPAARSPVGAVGLYQFMPATAREYGLRLSPVDERLDAMKNARAAARYLKYLHGRFGNWPLALAAYNCGQGRVSKVLTASGGKTFDDIHDQLPAETRMYVPKIAALVHLRENANLDHL